MTIHARKTVQDLIGEQISAICFVMDYVELNFNGIVLRSLTKPILFYQGREYIFPTPGSRDALCSMIGCEVTQVDIRDDVSLRLITNDNHILEIPLDQASRESPEAMHFVPELNGPIDVW